MSIGLTTWASGIFTQKSLVALSITSTLTTYLPAKLSPHLEDIMFVIMGWMLAVILSLIELATNTARTKTGKQRMKMLTLSKIVIFTMIFFFLKFFHLWILFDDHVIVGATVNVLVISVYALIGLGEFKLIGKNLKKKYNHKPKVFLYLDILEKTITKRFIKKIEETCETKDYEKEEG